MTHPAHIFAGIYIFFRIISYNYLYSLIISGTIILMYNFIKNTMQIYIETQMRIIRENHGIWELTGH